MHDFLVKEKSITKGRNQTHLVNNFRGENIGDENL